MKLFILFLIMIFIKFLINIFRLLKTLYLYKKFKSKTNMTSYIPEIDILFKHADTSYQTTYDERKHGYVERTLREVAYLSDKKEYFHEVNKVFQLTIGVYRMRAKSSINPFYWIFLPLNILYTTGVNPPKILKCIISIAYWIIGFLASYHLEILLDTVYLDYFQRLIEKLL